MVEATAPLEQTTEVATRATQRRREEQQKEKEKESEPKQW